MKRSLLRILASVVVCSTMAVTANAVTFGIRQGNGTEQYYRLEVPPGTTLGKMAHDPDVPYSVNNKMSAGAAKAAAVAWAGGLSKSMAGDPYTNSNNDIGAEKPGGFYNASYIKVDSVQYETSPVAYYLVQMTGKIGDTRQTFYAIVLDDGRIIRPTPVSGAESTQQPKPRQRMKHGRA
ncbi:MAG: hypothetical protein JO069_03665 [Verrucomicrobia bacterium]|nr:hypothetical protein [Verrucomicrobiota bacterium]